jgi:hypothetical protein
MRIILPLIALAFSIAAAPAPKPVSPILPTPVIGEGDRAGCRDRIEEVRNDRGLPKLDRKAASPDDGLLIAAVDKRIDGCSVLVMRNDTRDIRPLPTAPDGPPRVQPIPGQ